MSVSELPNEVRDRELPGAGLRSADSTVADEPPRYRTEIPIAIVGFTALVLAVFGRHITQGGFWLDDWRILAATQHLSNVFSAHSALVSVGLNPRPLLALALVVTDKIFGLHEHFYLVFATLVGVATSTSLYAVVREAGLSRLVAGAAGALVVLFPWSDVSQITAVAAQNQLALCILLLGTWAGLRALRGGAAWLITAVAAYVVSVLWYEEAAALVIASAVLVGIRGRNRRALIHGCAAVAATAVTTVLVEASGRPEAQTTIGGVLRHSRTIAQQAWQILGSALMPADTLWRLGSFLAVALVVAAAILQRLLAAGDPARERMRQALAVVAFGVFAMVLGYGPIAAAIDWYVPLQPGQGTRTNTAASVGWALTIVGLLMLLVGVGAYLLRRSNRAQIQVALAAAVAVVGFTWATRTAADARDWDEAAQIQRSLLGLIKAAVPAPAANSTFVVFSAPRATTAEVPVFLIPDDLSAALQVYFHRQDVRGWPINGATTVSCGDTGPVTQGGWIAPQSGARYGATYFVDYANAHVLPVPNAKTCKQYLPGLRAGPMALFQ